MHLSHLVAPGVVAASRVMPGPLLGEVLIEDLMSEARVFGLIPRRLPPPTISRLRQRGALRAVVQGLGLPRIAKQVVGHFLAINKLELVDLGQAALGRVARFLSHSHRGPAAVRLVAPIWYFPLRCSTCHQHLSTPWACSVCRAVD